MLAVIRERGFDSTEEIAEQLYLCYLSRATMENPIIKANYDSLEQQLKDMPFDQSDSIIRAAVAVSTESEKQAFLDGFSLGAKLILNVMDQ